jgi:hypothetical protein
MQHWRERMNPPERWLHEQIKLGRQLFLVLDSIGQLDERNALAGELGVDRYRNLYSGTPADTMASVGPYLFQLESFTQPSIQALLSTPQRHWGWLASANDGDLDALTAHWRDRLVTGERPNQALYRFHDNRVLGRAVAYLQPQQLPDFLGPMLSVCYWQAEQWTFIDNLHPGLYPLPANPAWLNTPTPESVSASVQFDNARRYLVSKHTDTLAKLAAHQEMDTWIRGQLDLARTWGWQETEHIQFLLAQCLKAPGFTPPEYWTPQPHETPSMHFDRLLQENLYWQGDAPV